MGQKFRCSSLRIISEIASEVCKSRNANESQVFASPCRRKSEIENFYMPPHSTSQEWRCSFFFDRYCITVLGAESNSSISYCFMFVLPARRTVTKTKIVNKRYENENSFSLLPLRMSKLPSQL